jgi:hypothetical protein
MVSSFIFRKIAEGNEGREEKAYIFLFLGLKMLSIDKDRQGFSK